MAFCKCRPGKDRARDYLSGFSRTGRRFLRRIHSRRHEDHSTCPVPDLVPINVALARILEQLFRLSGRWLAVENGRNLVIASHESVGPDAGRRLRVGAQHIRGDDPAELYAPKRDEKDHARERGDDCAVSGKESRVTFQRVLQTASIRATAGTGYGVSAYGRRLDIWSP